MWGGDVLCKLCAYGKMSDQAARIAELEALLSPEGTIHKRVLRLVEVARRMGFERAGEAAWNQAGDIEESAVESLERDVEDGYWDEPIAYRMGLYLHETVYAYRHYDEDSDEYSVFVLDDQAEAEKRVARKDGA
jgi:hypothetical protein